MGKIGDKYSVDISEAREHAEWDGFLANIGLGGHHEQTTCWAAAMRPMGWRAIRMVIRRKGRITGGAQLLIQIKRVVGSIVYLRWGPCFADDDPVARRIWVDKLHAWAKELGAAYIVVNPNCAQNDALVSYLRRKGFRSKKEKLPPWKLTVATLIIDLSKPLDQLWAEMRPNLRRQIRRGLETDLVFREGGENDLATFFELMTCTAHRRGEKPSPASLLYFQRLWQAFEPCRGVRLFLVEKSGRTIASTFVFCLGDVVRFWKIGWAGDHSKLRPTQLLHWHLIKWCKENGYKFIDIIQVEPEIAARICSKQALTAEQKKHPLFGPTQFKMGFGGNIFHYPGAFYRFYNPLWRMLFEFVIAPAMKIPLTKRIVHWIL